VRVSVDAHPIAKEARSLAGFSRATEIVVSRFLDAARFLAQMCTRALSLDTLAASAFGLPQAAEGADSPRDVVDEDRPGAEGTNWKESCWGLISPL